MFRSGSVQFWLHLQLSLGYVFPAMARQQLLPFSEGSSVLNLKGRAPLEPRFLKTECLTHPFSGLLDVLGPGSESALQV